MTLKNYTYQEFHDVEEGWLQSTEELMKLESLRGLFIGKNQLHNPVKSQQTRRRHQRAPENLGVCLSPQWYQLWHFDDFQKIVLERFFKICTQM